MSAVAAAARMLALVPWLLERPGATVAEIAGAFGVDPATIREDLHHLDFCGLPGLGGGDLFEVDIVGDRVVVRMADELKRPLRLTPREALRLVLTVGSVADALGDEVPALRSALDKVQAAAGVPRDAAVRVDAEGTPWLASLREALRAGVRTIVDYRGRNDTQPRRRAVDPWALHVVDGIWYLQGHDHASGERRTFRLDRIAGVEVTDEPVAEPAPEGPLPAPRYEPGPDDTEVTLHLDASVRYLADAVAADVVEEAGDGGLTVTFATGAWPWVERLVLGAGGAVTVRSPRALTARVAERAAAALVRYAPADHAG